MISLKCNPLDTVRITSGFGKRQLGNLQFHSGIDLGARSPGVQGDNIYAVADGKVVVSKANGGNPKTGYGWYVVIEHNGFCTLYGHMIRLEVSVGQRVTAGQIIGHMGNSGLSTAAHLHFEIRDCTYAQFWTRGELNGEYTNAVDPSSYLIDEVNRDKLNRQVVQSKCGFDENTMRYLDNYRWSKALYEKIVKAIR